MKKLSKTELNKINGGLALWIIGGLIFIGAGLIGFIAGKLSKRKKNRG